MHQAYAQIPSTVRDIIVDRDTVFEINNLRKSAEAVDYSFIKRSLEIETKDTPFRVLDFQEKYKSMPDGVGFVFYDNNMPKIKMEYRNGLKNGYWYYWNAMVN